MKPLVVNANLAFANDKGCFVGRAYFQAPDIDGNVYFTSTDDVIVNQGEKYTVKITRTTNYDLYGRVL